MADIYDRQTRSKVMGRIRKTDTKPELTVRRLLHRLGYRFRLHRRDLPGVPDITLPKYRTIIFVQGCFWHQHSCKLGKAPKSNRRYWLPKLKGNRNRDARNIKELRQLGWRVIIVWECEAMNGSRLEAKIASHLPFRSRHGNLSNDRCDTGNMV